MSIPTDAVRAWARDRCGGEVVGLDRMPGHSGITVGVDVRVAGDLRRYVLRIAPPGASGAARALLRTVPALRAAGAAGVPVPAVRDSGTGWFGTAYVVVDRMPGTTLGDVLADATADAAPDRGALFGEALDALAAIHAVDVRGGLAGWNPPAPLGETADRWLRLLERSAPEWASAGRTLAALLRRDVPTPRRSGLVHGDFYSNNWLFSGGERPEREPTVEQGGRLTAVLDWEAAHLGPPEVDLGYVAMMHDPHCWEPSLRPDLALTPAPDALLARYAAATGSPVPDVRWFRASAGLRLAALTGHFVGLHRSGRRPNPTWERIAASAPRMLERGIALLRRL